MKTAIILLFTLLTASLHAQDAKTNEGPDTVIPLMVMDDVPLSDALKNLAREAHINYIFDPRVTASFHPEPLVTKRWEKASLGKAINEVLTDNKLKLTTNASSQVVRVIPASDPVKPAPTNQIPGSAGDEMPLIVMDEVPLKDAILNLARQARLKVELDPALDAFDSGINGARLGRMMVSLRWEKLTARQALDAVLENYGLELLDDPKGSGVRTVTKIKSATGK